MSDTSGRVTFGPAGNKIRREIRLRGPDPARWTPSPAVAAATAAATTPVREPVSGQAAIAVSVGFVTESIWKQLDGEGLLKKAFLSSELVALLKRVATFIEIAAGEGIEGVINEFDVKADAAFGWLQRKIRETAVVKEPTEFGGAAHRAFQVGSNEWAAKLLGKKDPTKFKVNDLVEAVRRSVDEALVLSPDRILLDYGKRIVASLIGSGEANAKVAPLGTQGFEWQHANFMKQHSQAEQWGARAIPSTVKAYLSELLG